MKKVNHVEVSEGDTKIVASAKCPLKEDEVVENQLFNDCVICINERQDFVCRYFYGAIYPSKKDGSLYVDCRR